MKTNVVSGLLWVGGFAGTVYLGPLHCYPENWLSHGERDTNHNKKKEEEKENNFYFHNIVEYKRRI